MIFPSTVTEGKAVARGLRNRRHSGTVVGVGLPGLEWVWTRECIRTTAPSGTQGPLWSPHVPEHLKIHNLISVVLGKWGAGSPPRSGGQFRTHARETAVPPNVCLWETLSNRILFFFFFLAMPHGMWDLSSPTRDRTHAPCIGSAES